LTIVQCSYAPSSLVPIQWSAHPGGAAHLSVNTAFRKQLVSLHTWSGLLIGLVLAFLALSAAGFVLRPALERTLYGHLLTVPTCSHPLPLDRLAAAARAAHSRGSLESIEITSGNTSSIAVKFSDDDLVYVEPCTAAVLGTQNEYGGFFGFF